MNVLNKISRALFAFVAVPLYWVEKRESERRLEERLKRLEGKSRLVTAQKVETNK